MKKKIDNMQAEHIYEMMARRCGTGSELLTTLKEVLKVERKIMVPRT